MVSISRRNFGVSSCLVLVIVGRLCGGALAQTSGGCTSALTSLMPCLNYVTGNTSTPSSSCCSQLANVVQNTPSCLCTLLSGGVPSLGITINQTLALSLPGACKVQTPPISQCKAATAPTSAATPPVSAAAPSPSDFSNETPEPAITPSASDIPSGGRSGSKTVPTTATTGSSDASIVKAPLQFVIFVLFMAWCGPVTKY